MLIFVDKSTDLLMDPVELDVLSDLIENLLFKDFLNEENEKATNLLAIFAIEESAYDYNDEDDELGEMGGSEIERLVFCRGEGRADDLFESIIHQIWLGLSTNQIRELGEPEVYSSALIFGLPDQNGEDTGLRLTQLVNKYYENCYIMVFTASKEDGLQMTIEGVCGLSYALDIMLEPEEPNREDVANIFGNIDKMTVTAIKRRIESWFASNRPSILAWKKARTQR